MTINASNHAPTRHEALESSSHVIRRQSPLLMFLLGVLSAVIACHVWDKSASDDLGKRILGLHIPNVPSALRQPSVALPPLPPSWRSAENDAGAKVQSANRTLALTGVNGETFADADLTRAILTQPAEAAAAEPHTYTAAEISVPKNLQVGDMLTLMTRSGEVQSFRVTSRRALPCVADAKREPVPDTALLNCASGQAAARALWEYVIEAINTPPQTQKPKAVTQPL